MKRTLARGALASGLLTACGSGSGGSTGTADGGSGGAPGAMNAGNAAWGQVFANAIAPVCAATKAGVVLTTTTGTATTSEPLSSGNFEAGTRVASFSADGKSVFAASVPASPSDGLLFSELHAATDGQGGSIVGGQFEGALTLGGATANAPMGTFGVFLAKLDAGGHVVWGGAFTGALQLYLGDLAVGAAGDVWIAGTLFSGAVDFGGGKVPSDTKISSSVYVAHFDAGGHHVASAAFPVSTPNGGTSPGVSKIVVGADGRPTIFGAFTGSLPLGTGTLASPTGTTNRPSSFFATFDPASHVLASGQIVGDAPLSAVAMDAAGAFVVAGQCGTTPVDLGGGPQPCPARAAFLAKSAPPKNVFFRTFTPAADVSAASGTSTSGDVLLNAVATDPHGEIYLAGAMLGDVDLGTGPLVWTRAATIDTYGRGRDAFVAAFDPTGKPLWSRAYGDAADQGAESLAVDTSGHLFVAGTFGGSLAFGGGTLTAASASDGFLLMIPQ